MDITLDYAEDRFIHINRIKVRYRSLGQGKQTSLFIHGLAGSLEHWYKLVPELVQHYHLITLDLPGFGLSEKPSVIYSADFYMQFLQNFMMKLQLRDVTLVGHSFGGGLALKFALELPHAVHRLILISNAGFSQKLSLFLRLLTIPGLRRMLTIINRTSVNMGLKMIVYDKRHIEKHFVDRMYDLFKLPEFHRAFFSTLAQSANCFGAKLALYQSINNALTHLRIPTLVFWGDSDPILPFSWQQQSLQRLPCMTLRLLPKCGHLPYLEYPDIVGNEVRRFIRNSTYLF